MTESNRKMKKSKPAHHIVQLELFQQEKFKLFDILTLITLKHGKLFNRTHNEYLGCNSVFKLFRKFVKLMINVKTGSGSERN